MTWTKKQLNEYTDFLIDNICGKGEPKLTAISHLPLFEHIELNTDISKLTQLQIIVLKGLKAGCILFQKWKSCVSGRNWYLGMMASSTDRYCYPIKVPCSTILSLYNKGFIIIDKKDQRWMGDAYKLRKKI